MIFGCPAGLVVHASVALSSLEVCISVSVSVESHHRIFEVLETNMSRNTFLTWAFSNLCLRVRWHHLDLCLQGDAMVLGLLV